MKMTKLSLIAALAVSAAMAGGDITPVEPTTTPTVEESSSLSVSANMALTSNYIWRGMTQSSDEAAIQGGIDLEYNGFYLGTWGSSVNFGPADNSAMELDIYAGYAGEFSGIEYDIGIIQYRYPGESGNNFEEAYIGISKEFGSVALSATYSFGLDDAPDNIEVGASTELTEGFGIEATYGDYENVGTYYSAALTKSIGKFDLSLGYYAHSSDAGSIADEDNVVFTISTSF